MPAIETLTDSQKRILHPRAVELPIVTITDAAVSMVSNTRYQGSIASFTADRHYTLPAGTTGDIIEVFITSGDDAFELILLGAGGVAINGGSAATEWSRVFISNEFVRFRCIATNDWRVEIDGRIPQCGKMRQDVAQNFTHDVATKITFDSTLTNVGDLVDLTNDRLVPRRTGRYLVVIRHSFSLIPPDSRVIAYCYVNSAAVDLVASFTSYGSDAGAYPQITTEQPVNAGHAVEAFSQWDRVGGSGTEASGVSSNLVKPVFSLVELL